jgi:hypothetical protein
MNNNFKFFCPVGVIQKAKDKEGNEIMRLGGIASTMDKDSDGEFLDPTGFDISEFKKSGVINWHHQSKNSPSAIIGEPHKAEIRKDGFYVEADLYPNSKLAQEVYEVAQVMALDSKTRRLGYSIEGTVVERDEDNPKIVKKAIITGLAITHMPKNAQTFADIIKGKVLVDDEEEKSLTTESGGALKKESVDSGKFKIKKMSSNTRYDKIFETYPGISIEKADKLNDLFTQIQEKMLGKTITDADIEKAIDVLGLDLNDNPFIEKAKKSKNVSEMSADEIAENVTKQQFGNEDSDEDDDDEEETEDEETEDEDEDEDDDNVEKDLSTSNASPGTGSTPSKIQKGKKENSLVKAINDSVEKQSKESRALATLIKAQMGQTDLLKGQIAEQGSALEATKSELAETRELLNKAQETIGQLAGATQGRKSITKGFTERNFGENGERKQNDGGTILSKSRDAARILQIIDESTFEKGAYDQEFGDATTSFEATKQLPINVIHRLKLEKRISIVD